MATQDPTPQDGATHAIEMLLTMLLSERLRAGRAPDPEKVAAHYLDALEAYARAKLPDQTAGTFLATARRVVGRAAQLARGASPPTLH